MSFTVLTLKRDEAFVKACAESAQTFAKQGPVECVFSVDHKVVQVIEFVLETDVATLRAEVARLKEEKDALEKEKCQRIQWECHRGND